MSQFALSNTQFFREISDGLQRGIYFLFVGAGFSTLSGFPDGSTLAQELRASFAKYLPTPSQKESGSGDLDSIIELTLQGFGLREKDGRTEICAKIQEIFDHVTKPQDDPYDTLAFIVNQLLAKDPTPVYYIVTTNWDDCLRDAFGNNAYIISRPEHYDDKASLNSKRIRIIKLHGDLGDSSNMVLMRKDRLGKKNRDLLLQHLGSVLLEKWALVLGYRMRDPDVLQAFKSVRKSIPSLEGQNDWIIVDPSDVQSVEREAPSSAKVVGEDLRDFLLGLGSQFDITLDGGVELEFDQEVINSIQGGTSVLLTGPIACGYTTTSNRLRGKLSRPPTCVEARAFSPIDESAKVEQALNSMVATKGLLLLAPEHYLRFLEGEIFRHLAFDKQTRTKLPATLGKTKGLRRIGRALTDTEVAKRVQAQLHSHPQLQYLEKIIVSRSDKQRNRESISVIRGLERVGVLRRVKHVLTYSDASKVLQRHAHDHGLEVILHSKEFCDSILSYSRREFRDPYEGNERYHTYCPSLISSIVKKIDDERKKRPGLSIQSLETWIRTDLKDRQPHSDLSIGLLGLGASRLALSEEFKDVMATAGAIVSGVLSPVVFGPVISIIGGIVAGGLILPSLGREFKEWREKKERGGAEKVSFKTFREVADNWIRVPDEERRILCYQLDQEYGSNAQPGRTYDLLSILFSGPALIDRLERAVRERHEELLVTLEKSLTAFEGKWAQQAEDLDHRIQNLRDEVEQRDDRRALLQGVVRNPSEWGITLDPPTLELPRFGGESQFRIVTSSKFLELAADFARDLAQAKPILLVGPKGIGKSVLARYVIAKMLKRGSDSRGNRVEIITLEDLTDTISLGKVTNYIATNSGTTNVLLYDPSPIGYYVERFQTGADLQHIGMNIVNALQISYSYGSPCIVVVSDDLWSQLETQISKDVSVRVRRIDLRDTKFLAELIRTYGGVECSDAIVESLATSINRLQVAYTLVAKYSGLWLHQNACKVKDVESAVRESKEQPKEFLKRYIWMSILRSDEDLGARFALPLLVHRYFGNMPIIWARELPRLVGMPALNEFLSNWIAHNHEDLLEESLEELVDEGERVSTETGSLRHGSVGDFVQTLAKTFQHVRGMDEYAEDSLTMREDQPLIQREITMNYRKLRGFIERFLEKKLREQLSPSASEVLLRSYASCVGLVGLKLDSHSLEEGSHRCYDWLFLDGSLTQASRTALVGDPDGPESLAWRLRDNLGLDKTHHCQALSRDLESLDQDVGVNATGLLAHCIAISMMQHGTEDAECVANVFRTLNLLGRDVRAAEHLMHVKISVRLIESCRPILTQGRLFVQYANYLNSIMREPELPSLLLDTMQRLDENSPWVGMLEIARIAALKSASTLDQLGYAVAAELLKGSKTIAEKIEQEMKGDLDEKSGEERPANYRGVLARAVVFPLIGQTLARLGKSEPAQRYLDVGLGCIEELRKGMKAETVSGDARDFAILNQLEPFLKNRIGEKRKATAQDYLSSLEKETDSLEAVVHLSKAESLQMFEERNESRMKEAEREAELASELFTRGGQLLEAAQSQSLSLTFNVLSDPSGIRFESFVRHYDLNVLLFLPQAAFVQSIIANVLLGNVDEALSELDAKGPIIFSTDQAGLVLTQGLLTLLGIDFEKKFRPRFYLEAIIRANAVYYLRALAPALEYSLMRAIGSGTDPAALREKCALTEDPSTCRELLDATIKNSLSASLSELIPDWSDTAGFVTNRAAVFMPLLEKEEISPLDALAGLIFSENQFGVYILIVKAIIDRNLEYARTLAESLIDHQFVPGRVRLRQVVQALDKIAAIKTVDEMKANREAMISLARVLFTF